MKYTYINTLAAIAGLALATTSANAALLAVDFGGSNVESGFVGQSATSFTHTTTAGDITVGISGQQGLFTFTTNTGTAHTNLFQDFFFKNGGTITMTLTGPGISANTEYDMTFWALYAAEARNTTINATVGTGPSLGPIAYEINPTSLSQNAASGTFTSDSNGDLTFAVSGTNSRPALNGFTITAVPEPSTTALLGLGGLALILRRRK
jgi:hypothetical protein